MIAKKIKLVLKALSGGKSFGNKRSLREIDAEKLKVEQAIPQRFDSRNRLILFFEILSA